MSTKKNLVVIIGGFAGEITAYADEISALEKSGKTVLFFNPKGTIQEKMGSVYAETKNLGEIDLVGFSEGAIVATKLATELQIRRLILVNPAGLIGKDSVAVLICRFIRQVIEEEMHALNCALHLNFNPLRVLTRVELEFLKNCLCNPHLWQELSEITQARIESSLYDLKKGRVEIILISAKSDRIFPEERIAKVLKEFHPVEWIKWVNFVEKDASHNASFLKEPGVLRQILAGEN